MNCSGKILLFAVALLAAGCSQSRWAIEEAAKREARQQFDTHYQLQAAGIQNSYDYEHSGFVKNHDIAGYIEQTRQKKEAEVEAYNKALPSITEKVRTCVFKGHKSTETCFNQLTDSEKSYFTTRLRFDAAGKSFIEDRKQDMLNPIIKELKAAQQEKADEEFTVMIMKARAREQKQAEAERQAAKRAYDNSIQSLVE